ncbi:unnamed protein product [Musa acuminata subsp. malaccensis]|uniref:(wild Malaysian banana) hypothetical protein n=1 Tax=Musa acuminata subsp. malaccensis TaxID=214687 RepID=A0A804K571_MUSAM|nr:unnamed protein product [Musa acuminata subsp. malaccensis]
MSREQRRGARGPPQRTLKPPPDGVEFRRKRSLTGLPIFSPSFEESAVTSAFLFSHPGLMQSFSYIFVLVRSLHSTPQFSHLNFLTQVFFSPRFDTIVLLYFCPGASLKKAQSRRPSYFLTQATLYLASNTMDRVSFSWFSDHAESTVIFLPR